MFTTFFAILTAFVGVADEIRTEGLASGSVERESFICIDKLEDAGCNVNMVEPYVGYDPDRISRIALKVALATRANMVWR